MKLTRVLQDHVIERVGANQPIPVDVRVIAASKRDLGQMVAQGRFREDLYHRLSVITLALPPLREHAEDIATLLHHFLERAFRRRGLAAPAMPPHIEQAFLRYGWPGRR